MNKKDSLIPADVWVDCAEYLDEVSRIRLACCQKDIRSLMEKKPHLWIKLILLYAIQFEAIIDENENEFEEEGEDDEDEEDDDDEEEWSCKNENLFCFYDKHTLPSSFSWLDALIHIQYKFHKKSEKWSDMKKIRSFEFGNHKWDRISNCELETAIHKASISYDNFHHTYLDSQTTTYFGDVGIFKAMTTENMGRTTNSQVGCVDFKDKQIKKDLHKIIELFGVEYCEFSFGNEVKSVSQIYKFISEEKLNFHTLAVGENEGTILQVRNDLLNMLERFLSLKIEELSPSQYIAIVNKALIKLQVKYLRFIDESISLDECEFDGINEEEEEEEEEVTNTDMYNYIVDFFKSECLNLKLSKSSVMRMLSKKDSGIRLHKNSYYRISRFFEPLYTVIKSFLRGNRTESGKIAFVELSDSDMLSGDNDHRDLVNFAYISNENVAVVVSIHSSHC